jgi:hypothetical protein
VWQTVKRALANPKTDADSRDVTSVINPAIDMLRAIHAQTELAQRCFGDLKFTDAEPGGSTENLTDEVTEGVARLVSLPPGTPTRTGLRGAEIDASAQLRKSSCVSIFPALEIGRVLGRLRISSSKRPNTQT